MQSLIIRLSLILIVIISTSSHASIISVNASADISEDMPADLLLIPDLFPIGTTISSNIYFELSPEPIETSNITSATGSFTWNDSIHGAQTFFAESGYVSGYDYLGIITLIFSGYGPTINGITVEDFGINFNTNINPFTPPGNSVQLHDLVLNSSISGMSVGVSKSGYGERNDFQSNVSGSVINAVPIPGALFLFLSGLTGLLSSKLMIADTAT